MFLLFAKVKANHSNNGRNRGIYRINSARFWVFVLNFSFPFLSCRFNSKARNGTESSERMHRKLVIITYSVCISWITVHKVHAHIKRLLQWRKRERVLCCVDIAYRNMIRARTRTLGLGLDSVQHNRTTNVIHCFIISFYVSMPLGKCYWNCLNAWIRIFDSLTV